MMTLYEPPVSHILTTLLVLAGAGAAVTGVRMMSRALRRGMRSTSSGAFAS